MNIGKKPLSDAEFANMWAILYREFYNLSQTSICDATLVYNTIYTICTSASNLEDKLYWKIGDFFYNRCKEHSSAILFSDDYIYEYIIRFQRYDSLVRSTNKLGCFLNECIKGRKIDDFGYLLWERCIIQHLPATFFEDIYEYPKNIRIEAIKTLENIVPDVNSKLLYYKEKYEKIALEKIKKKYKNVPDIIDLESLSVAVHKIVKEEREVFHEYFLPDSLKKVELVLEECLFGKKTPEIIFRTMERIRNENLSNITNILSRSERPIICQDLYYNFSNFPYSNNTFDPELYKIVNMDVLSNINILIEKGKCTSKSLHTECGTDQIAKIENNYINCNSFECPFLALYKNLGILDSGFIILKKAYAAYITETLNLSNSLGSTVECIYHLYQGLKLFDCHPDFNEILISIFKYSLQRIKPCFITRLCTFSRSIVGSIYIPLQKSNIRFDNNSIGFEKYCVENSSLQIFNALVELVNDRNELMNIYIITLRDRLFSRSSDLNKEVLLLENLGVSTEERAYQMIHNINSCIINGSMRLLNSIYWGIEPENSGMKIPEELLREICVQKDVSKNNSVSFIEQPLQSISAKTASSSRVIDAKPFSENSKKLSSQIEDSNVQSISLNISNNGEYIYKLASSEGMDKVLKLAHQFSKVTLDINGFTIIMNIYQYAIFDEICKNPTSLLDLCIKYRIGDATVKNVISSLGGFIKKVDRIYYLDCSDIKSIDISLAEVTSNANLEICVNSYLQSLGVTILKKIKKATKNELAKEMIELSRIEIGSVKAEEIIEGLIERGMGEIVNDLIEYVS